MEKTMERFELSNDPNVHYIGHQYSGELEYPYQLVEYVDCENGNFRIEARGPVVWGPNA